MIVKPTVRSTVKRWKRLARILNSLDTAFAANARVDAYETPATEADAAARNSALRAVEVYLAKLDAVVDQELSKLTCELLHVQLERRKMRAEQDRVRHLDRQRDRSPVSVSEAA